MREQGTILQFDNLPMRCLILFVLLVMATALHADDWRAAALHLALQGDGPALVDHAERARAPWLAPHLARGLSPPPHYLGWVAAGDVYIVYRIRPVPQFRIVSASTPFSEISDWLDEADHWFMALDGGLSSSVPEALYPHTIVRTATERSAALAAHRVARARERPKTLFAYARAAEDDPESLPAANAELALVADALGGGAVLLVGDSAMQDLRLAVHDGRLSDARFVLFAAHAGPHPDNPGMLALQLAPGEEGRYTAADILHLQFNAELVVLSACETALADEHPRMVSGFAQAALFAGVGYTLLTQWRVDDAASAQFVAVLFGHIAAGSSVESALHATRGAFKRGEYGDRYRAPFFWAGWQLWGG